MTDKHAIRRQRINDLKHALKGVKRESSETGHLWAFNNMLQMWHYLQACFQVENTSHKIILLILK